MRTRLGARVSGDMYRCDRCRWTEQLALIARLEREEKEKEKGEELTCRSHGSGVNSTFSQREVPMISAFHLQRGTAIRPKALNWTPGHERRAATRREKIGSCSLHTDVHLGFHAAAQTGRSRHTRHNACVLERIKPRRKKYWPRSEPNPPHSGETGDIGSAEAAKHRKRDSPDRCARNTNGVTLCSTVLRVRSVLPARKCPVIYLARWKNCRVALRDASVARSREHEASDFDSKWAFYGTRAAAARCASRSLFPYMAIPPLEFHSNDECGCIPRDTAGQYFPGRARVSRMKVSKRLCGL